MPGDGAQPVAAALGELVRNGFRGSVVAEVNTRRARGRAERERALARTLEFARRSLARTPEVTA